MIFKRKIYKRLLDWKAGSNGSKALLIEGARRIGKSTERYATRSLEKFNEKFRNRIGENYIIHPKNLRQDTDTLFIPAYMAFCL